MGDQVTNHGETCTVSCSSAYRFDRCALDRRRSIESIVKGIRERIYKGAASSGCPQASQASREAQCTDGYRDRINEKKLPHQVSSSLAPLRPLQRQSSLWR